MSGRQVEIVELERRMRPGAWSAGGFLGPTERLEDVLSADARTLTELAVTADELADALSLLTDAASIATTLFLAIAEDRRWEGLEAVMSDRRALIEQRFGAVEGVGPRVARVGGRYEVEWWGFMGVQECPWGSRLGDGDVCATSPTEWRIRDTTRGLEMRGPGLITHLITEHGFFEGLESPYRVDPRGLAELLQLGPSARAP